MHFEMILPLESLGSWGILAARCCGPDIMLWFHAGNEGWMGSTSKRGADGGRNG